jgi:adenine-specific DNA-methyltransferase
MIEKKTAKKHKVNIIESNNTLTDEKSELMNKIKDLLPGIVNSDDQLDLKALNDLIDIANTTSNNQGYELTFAGKGIARALADEPTNKELKVEMKQSKNFDSTGNVIIKGDNIDALKVLYQNYHNKIKMIYIDPPYNTKSENFIYKDNFKESDERLIEEFGLGEETVNFLDNVYGTRSHSGWLAFMYPRLRLARELLRDDGVIFISIDDNEQANLKIMCDEIFGEENFVENFIWRSRLGKGATSKKTATLHENVICYAKNINSLIIASDVRIKSKKSKEKLRQWGQGDKREDRPTMYYAVHSKEFKDIYPIKSDGSDGRWRLGKDKFKELQKQNLVIFEKQDDGRIEAYKIIPEGSQTETAQDSILINEIVKTTAHGSKEIMKLFDFHTFDYPKPTSLLKHFISIICKDNIILDFFAGSGTTAHAVMQLNAEDNGNRKFILVQWDEEITKDKPAYKFCKENKLEPVISSICIERVNRAGKKILKEQKEKDGIFQREVPLDIGYKVFSLTDKTRVKFDSDDHLFKVESNRSSRFDTLYNMLAATCKPLDTPVKEIKKGSIYKADNEIYLLGNVTKKEIEQYKDLKVNIDAFADFDLQNYLNLGISGEDNVTVVY